MKDFINAATMGTGGSSLTSAATGQMTVAVISLLLMAAFGIWGAYLRWKDSKALREALDRDDVKEAIRIRGNNHELSKERGISRFRRCAIFNCSTLEEIEASGTDRIKILLVSGQFVLESLEAMLF